LLALPQAFVLTHGALQHARAIAEGMVVDTERMHRNLNATNGLIVAEAVMMGLAPTLGREHAHHVVGRASDTALREGISLADALAREIDITTQANIDIRRLTDPTAYLGSAGAFIDRVLEQAYTAGASA
jgi:3-carboxy-cis,cis-muconate cycloisomerase